MWLLAVVGVLAVFEFHGLCRARGIETAPVLSAAFMAALLAPWAWLAGVVKLEGIRGDLLILRNMVPALVVTAVLLKLVFRHGRFTVEGAAFTLAGFFYVGLLALLLMPPVPIKLVSHYLLFLLAANKGSDMAAYVVGKAIGRRKMAPVLSPNKTWEGCVGGAVGGTGAGLAVLLATPLRTAYAGVPAAHLLLFALLVTMAAQLGDLVESAFKRWAGVKDSGRLLPEFGGVLDMIDSFLISVPVAHVAGYLMTGTFRGA
jgi:phosphatidate cytidylyltransferase